MPDAKFGEVVGSLRSGVAGTKAVVWIGEDGEVLEYLSADTDFDIGTFTAEYTTLLRIARRTSEDTGSGELSEHISISDRSITLARSFSAGSHLILVTDVHAQLGRARYELKLATRRLEQTVRLSKTGR